MAEEQPVAAVRTYCATLLKEGSNGATPVPGPIMTIGTAGSVGKPKPCAFCTYTLSGLRVATLREVGRCNTKSPSVADVIAHRINCQSNSSGRGFGRG